MSKLISLTKSQFAIVDDADFDWLNHYKWYAQMHRSGSFYAARSDYTLGKRLVYMHKVILGIDKSDCDHINLNKLDNRRSNLRAATKAQNNANRSKQRHGKTSQYKGVSRYSNSNKWVVFISEKYIGYFTSELDAARAYNAAAILHFGEFAHLNVIEAQP